MIRSPREACSEPGRRAPLVIAHRGDQTAATENSLAAFAAARFGPADGVELDVRLCGSGELVVFHDPDLRRLAGRGEEVATTPLDTLRQLPLSGGHQIPTLDQVFEELGREMLVNIELKSTSDNRRRLVDLVAATTERHQAGDRVLLSSFDPLVVAIAGLRAGRLARGWLFHKGQPVPFRRGWLAPVLRATSVNPEHLLLTPERVARWRRYGYQIWTWTVDRPADLERAISLGVDAIISNDPTATAALVDRFRGRPTG